MVRHGVRRLVVVAAGRSPAWSRSTTSPRARAGARARARSRERAARLLLPRARTDVASANARITGCARVPSPASSGWNSVPRKNGWPASSSARGAPSSSWAPKTTPAARASRRSRARSRRRSGSARGCARRRRSARSACPARSVIGPSWPTSEHSSARSRRRRGAPYSAWWASSMPARSRARSRIACWKPPQVPRNGISSRRAVRDGVEHLLAVAVRAAGDHPDAVEAFEVVGLGGRDPVRVEHEARRAGAARRRAAGCARGRGRWGERSPTRASLAVVMAAHESPVRSSSRPTINRWPSDQQIADGPALSPDLRLRRPARLLLGRGARARATRSRPSPSTSRSWRPTSARRCCAPAGRADEAGARLLEHAEPILLRLDAARADVARVAAVRRGRCGSGRRRWRRVRRRARGARAGA